MLWDVIPSVIVVSPTVLNKIRKMTRVRIEPQALRVCTSTVNSRKYQTTNIEIILMMFIIKTNYKKLPIQFDT